MQGQPWNGLLPKLVRLKSNELCDVIFAHSNLFTPSDPTLGESQAALQAIKLAVFHNNSYVLFDQGIFQRVYWSSAVCSLNPSLIPCSVSLGNQGCSLFYYLLGNSFFLYFFRDINFFSHNLARWAVFYNWDGPISISFLLPRVISPKDWNGLQPFSCFYLYIYLYSQKIKNKNSLPIDNHIVVLFISEGRMLTFNCFFPLCWYHIV